MIKWIVPTALVCLLLGGCAPQPSVRAIGNHYFVSGDANCVQVIPRSDTEIICYNKQGNPTGIRTAVSAQQAYAFQLKQARDRAALQRSLQGIANMGRQAQTAALQQTQSMPIPQVQGIPQTNKESYNLVGDSVIGTDGTACTKSGETVVCQ